jgi:Ca2+-binding RTX toxin-like protein
VATYAFETMTPAEALAVTAADAILFPRLAANQVTVLYNPSGTISILAPGRALEFGPALASLGAAGRLILPDDARLFVGDAAANTVVAPGQQIAVSDGLYGGGGDDSMNGGLGDDLLQGNTGGDYLVGGGGRDVLYGGQDNDRIVTTIEIEDGVAFPTSDGGDFAQGNRGDDVILGGLGSDTLLGGQGGDTVSGLSGSSADFLNGNLGDDRVEGVGVLLGEDGADTLIGRGSADSLAGGDGADRITLLAGSADGGLANDAIDVIGGAGRAVAFGGDGSDTLQARVSRAEVQLSGGEGQDSLVGSFGSDTLSGDGGDDAIDGFGGRDLVSGGGGQDRFITRGVEIETSAELVRITDWESTDRIDFADDSFMPANSANYREITAESYDAAVAAATALRTTSDILYVSAQVGADVVVFGLGPSPAAVLLTGRTLADIAFNNVV